MKQKIKTFLQQLNFQLGRNPKLKICNNSIKYIPKPYKAVLIITADLELAWAWRYAKSCSNPLLKAIDKASKERENIPKILHICEKFNIPITWFTVGHLFLESCDKKDGIAHSELPRLAHFENDWWRFEGKDWFEYDPCTNYRLDPLWYCPDLIKKIVSSKINHEIGCHTFSHIDCRDEVCTPDHFKAEVEASRKAAKNLGIGNMESFVHPGHTIGNLDNLVDLGFTNYRTDYANILGFPRKHVNGLWEFTTTLELDYFPNWSINSQVKRYITLFKRSIQHNAVAYIWFHPSFDAVFVETILPPIFEWLDKNRKEIWIVTNGEYVRWLNRNISD